MYLPIVRKTWPMKPSGVQFRHQPLFRRDFQTTPPRSLIISIRFRLVVAR
jgi:hypothetical protein